MAGRGIALTGEAVSDPSSIRVDLSYSRLRARDLGKFCTGISDVYALAVKAATGHRTLTFSRGNERIRVRPDLDISESATGNSIKVRFTEGWMPSVRNKKEDIVIGIPQNTAIPLLAAYFLLQAVSYSIHLGSDYEDFRTKQFEVHLKQIEVQLKEKELSEAIGQKNDGALRRSIQVVRPILENDLITSCKINGVEIKHR